MRIYFIHLQLVDFTVMLASEDDMIAAKIPLKQRDYCAHKYLELEECKRIHYPFMLKCAHKRHEYEECQAEEWVIILFKLIAVI